MKYLEVKEFTPSSGNEWTPSAYPGLGLYLSYGALRLVDTGSVFQVSGALNAVLVEDRADETAKGAGSEILATVDIHRLMDQLMEQRRDERENCISLLRKPAEQST